MSFEKEVESSAREMVPETKGERAVTRPHYVLRITGDGMDTQVLINHADDMEIVEAVIRKLRGAVTP